MKKLFFAFLAFTLLFGCKDDDLSVQEQFDLDVTLIEDYLSENNIVDAIKDESGLFYRIDSVFAGNLHPVSTSLVSLAYEGRIMEDGTVFDSADAINPLKTQLFNLITGWQIGIPKFKRGESGTLYIPSGYAYGAIGNAVIPPNTILIFDIELLDFN